MRGARVGLKAGAAGGDRLQREGYASARAAEGAAGERGRAARTRREKDWVDWAAAKG